MKHNLIKTDNYLLIISDEEIKEGDWLYSISNQLVIQSNKGSANMINSKITVDVLYLKIISHLPINGAAVLEGVSLLPSLVDDVEKIAKDWMIKNKDADDARYTGFIDGYKISKEKYKYTEEDLRKAIEMAQECFICECFLGPHIEREHTEKSIIQSLQHHPKYPIAFECQMGVGDYGDKDGLRKFAKTIINSEGRTEWVGKYIYE